MRNSFLELGFKVNSRLEVGGSLEPLPVVKGFDPFKDGRARPDRQLPTTDMLGQKYAVPGADPMSRRDNRE